jgi:hypothetical protein
LDKLIVRPAVADNGSATPGALNWLYINYRYD